MIKLRYSHFSQDAWIRTCQECGNVQVEHVVPVYGTDLPITYTTRKCIKCKSEALDYGTDNAYNDSEDETEN